MKENEMGRKAGEHKRTRTPGSSLQAPKRKCGGGEKEGREGKPELQTPRYLNVQWFMYANT